MSCIYRWLLKHVGRILNGQWCCSLKKHLVFFKYIDFCQGNGKLESFRTVFLNNKLFLSLMALLLWAHQLSIEALAPLLPMNCISKQWYFSWPKTKLLKSAFCKLQFNEYTMSLQGNNWFTLSCFYLVFSHHGRGSLGATIKLFLCDLVKEWM